MLLRIQVFWDVTLLSAERFLMFQRIMVPLTFKLLRLPDPVMWLHHHPLKLLQTFWRRTLPAKHRGLFKSWHGGTSQCCIFVLHLAHMPDSPYIYYVFYVCYVVHDVSSHGMICSMWEWLARTVPGSRCDLWLEVTLRHRHTLYQVQTERTLDRD